MVPTCSTCHKTPNSWNLQLLLVLPMVWITLPVQKASQLLPIIAHYAFVSPSLSLSLSLCVCVCARTLLLPYLPNYLSHAWVMCLPCTLDTLSLIQRCHMQKHESGNTTIMEVPASKKKDPGSIFVKVI